MIKFCLSSLDKFGGYLLGGASFRSGYGASKAAARVWASLRASLFGSARLWLSETRPNSISPVRVSAAVT